MAPLKGKFVEEQRKVKYRNQKNSCEDVKETTLETTTPIYRGRASSCALNSPLK